MVSSELLKKRMPPDRRRHRMVHLVADDVLKEPAAGRRPQVWQIAAVCASRRDRAGSLRQVPLEPRKLSNPLSAATKRIGQQHLKIASR